MQDETRKIMHLPELRVSATCVRVPIYRAHSVAVTAEFERPVSVEQAREVLSKAPGLELVDEPHSNHYPMPLNVAGKDNCRGWPRASGLRAGERAVVLGFRRPATQRRGVERRSDRRIAVASAVLSGVRFICCSGACAKRPEHEGTRHLTQTPPHRAPKRRYKSGSGVFSFRSRWCYCAKIIMASAGVLVFCCFLFSTFRLPVGLALIG